MKKRAKLIILAVAAVLIIFAAFSGKKEKPQKFEKVEVEQVIVKKTVSASGVVKSKSEADLAFLASGRLDSIKVKVGDKVQKSTNIANLVSYDQYQQYLVKKQSLEIAKKDLEIYIEDYATNVSAVGGEDEYYLNIERLKELVIKSEADLGVTNAGFLAYNIVAPVDGTVVEFNYSVGEYIPAGSAVSKVADLNNLIFEASVDQADFGLLKLGQKVEVELDSHEDKIFAGTVLEIPQAVSDSGEFIVKIAISNPETLGAVGIDGDASIIIEQTVSEVSALPFDAVYKTNGDVFVWVENGGKLEKLTVETGLEGDIYTEIKTDLNGKTIVIPETEPTNDANGK